MREEKRRDKRKEERKREKRKEKSEKRKKRKDIRSACSMQYPASNSSQYLATTSAAIDQMENTKCILQKIE